MLLFVNEVTWGQMPCVIGIAHCEERFFRPVIAIERQSALGPVRLLPVMGRTVVQPREAIADVPCKHELYRRVRHRNIEELPVPLSILAIPHSKLLLLHFLPLHIEFSP